jgi:hypothetical protein
MKKWLFLLGIGVLITNNLFADRVCLEKTTGKLIEYQSGDAPLGTLIQNAVNAGYKKEDIEEKYINQQEWSVIKEKWINEPAKKEREEKQQKFDKAKNKLKTLGLTEEDISALFR